MVVINKHDNYHHLAILTGQLGLHLIQKRGARSMPESLYATETK